MVISDALAAQRFAVAAPIAQRIIACNRYAFNTRSSQHLVAVNTRGAVAWFSCLGVLAAEPPLLRMQDWWRRPHAVLQWTRPAGGWRTLGGIHWAAYLAKAGRAAAGRAGKLAWSAMLRQAHSPSAYMLAAQQHPCLPSALTPHQRHTRQHQCADTPPPRLHDRLALLAGPLVLQLVTGYSLLLVATVFLGHLSDDAALAAAVLANSLFNVSGWSIVNGLAAAMDTLCGQVGWCTGSRDHLTPPAICARRCLVPPPAPSPLLPPGPTSLPDGLRDPARAS